MYSLSFYFTNKQTIRENVLCTSKESDLFECT